MRWTIANETGSASDPKILKTSFEESNPGINRVIGSLEANPIQPQSKVHKVATQRSHQSSIVGLRFWLKSSLVLISIQNEHLSNGNLSTGSNILAYFFSNSTFEMQQFFLLVKKSDQKNPHLKSKSNFPTTWIWCHWNWTTKRH